MGADPDWRVDQPIVGIGAQCIHRRSGGGRCFIDWLRTHLRPDRISANSAGTDEMGIHPGADITGDRSYYPAGFLQSVFVPLAAGFDRGWGADHLRGAQDAQIDNQ